MTNDNPRSIAWMANNPVAANLFMLVFLIGGVIILFTQIRQEIFPEFEIDMVQISIPYPGASPDEVEKGIILAVEEAVQGLDGVKQIFSTASEGVASVNVELTYDANKNKMLADIKNEIDRITSFPTDAEEPVVNIPTRRREVMELVIYGDEAENVLRELAETVRNDLLKDEKITQVETEGIRPLEISVEVSQEQLRAYDLTIDYIAKSIATATVELPGGGLKTRGGEILLRTAERRDLAKEFEDLSIISTKDGTRVRLADIASVRESFEEVDVASFFNGKPAVMVNVFRVGDQTPLEIADAVKQYKERLDKALPPGIKTAIWRDRSEIFRQRVDLLTRNARIGLILVLVILGLFLEIRLAFWVTMGIPISFLGSFLFLPAADVSINMISLFAFIITLGMVVDDAIVIGENIYVHRQQITNYNEQITNNKQISNNNGQEPTTNPPNFIQASINGASEVAVPVVFSILTTIAAFAPLFFVEGIMGKVFRILPAVIITVLLISLFESLYILPAHLGHLGKFKENGFRGRIYRFQQRFGKMVENAAENIYGAMVRRAVKNQWITWAAGIFFLLIAVGFVKGGHVNIALFPKIESDWVVGSAALPYGVSLEETKKVQKRLEQAAQEVVAEQSKGQPSALCRGVFTSIRGTHSVRTIVFLVPMDQRDINATQFSRKWREKIGYLPGLESLTFDSTAGGPHGGSPIDVQLSHKDNTLLEQAASELAASLKAYTGVTDIDDGFSEGKVQLNLTVKPDAQSLGLTAAEIGRQLRHTFWGAEALRQQRGRDLIRVMVRFPKAERVSEYDVEELLIRIPEGGEIPLLQAAEIGRGKSYTSISRTDGRRVIHVTADMESNVANAKKVIDSLEKNEMPDLLERYPGLNFSFEGAEKEGRESMKGLVKGFLFAVLIMYVLIAIPFKSYLQPLVVLSAIPFGIIGAVAGHMMMGYSLSLVSMMGLLALAGVVVNDSLVLVHAANRMRESGMSVKDAVSAAGVRRFRPIILTSLTTFFGLMPMIFETSLQARFLIPMAISLGFGVLFATFITLLIVPAFYVILEDMKGILAEMRDDAGRILGGGRRKSL